MTKQTMYKSRRTVLVALALMLEARIPLKSEFRTFFLSPMKPSASTTKVG